MRFGALDLGNSALKALHLIDAGDAVEVVAFDTVTHAKNLAEVSGAEREEIIALSFRQFMEQNYVGKEDVVVSVPTQSSFARFVTLPPVEPKKVPEIIQFEAVQQIPFDIEEVVWDSQLMTEADAAEKRVGLFAIKNEVVNAELARFDREDLQVSTVQMASMALYNYLQFDRPDYVASETKPTVILNIGAETTDLVVCSRTSVWQRSIAIGGNAFTKAIASAFKINFAKAEKLKRTAAASKYARQIFQAMRPVFTDLASEVQKSIGFYTSSNPNAQIGRIVAMGGATRLRGLLKYLQQSLQIPVERPDRFKRVRLDENVSAAKFHDSISDFAVVYGLGVQVLGMGKIESNLLPKAVARQMAWAVKFKYFVLAASILLAVSLMALGRAILDKRAYESGSGIRRQNANLISMAENAIDKYKDEQDKSSDFQQRIQAAFKLLEKRDVVPLVCQTVLGVLPNAQTNPEQKGLYEAFAAGDAETVKQTPRSQRKQLFVTDMSVFYSKDLANAAFDAPEVSAEASDSGGGGASMSLEMRAMGGARAYNTRSSSRSSSDEEKPDAGFVVSVSGYSPYSNLSELLDPLGVEDRRQDWGFVTRLQHLDAYSIVDGNSLFELYNKIDLNHFQLKTGPVVAEDRRSQGRDGMPSGIGERLLVESEDGRGRGDYVLIDPLTKEVISSAVDSDPGDRTIRNRRTEAPFEPRDQWFELKFKLKWLGRSGTGRG